jgi:SAM-dependent methyltransferase
LEAGLNGVADKIIAHYQRHAAAWDADRRGAGWSDKRWHDRFIGLLPSPAAVLDLGCGGGSPIAVHLVAHCMRVTGIYRSPALIELCRERLPDQNNMRYAEAKSQSNVRWHFWLGTASFIFVPRISAPFSMCSRRTKYVNAVRKCEGLLALVNYSG